MTEQADDRRWKRHERRSKWMHRWYHVLRFLGLPDRPLPTPPSPLVGADDEKERPDA